VIDIENGSDNLVILKEEIKAFFRNLKLSKRGVEGTEEEYKI